MGLETRSTAVRSHPRLRAQAVAAPDRYLVRCDGCPAFMGPCDTPAEARAAAAGDGWLLKDLADGALHAVCARCLPAVRAAIEAAERNAAALAGLAANTAPIDHAPVADESTTPSSAEAPTDAAAPVTGESVATAEDALPAGDAAPDGTPAPTDAPTSRRGRKRNAS